MVTLKRMVNTYVEGDCGSMLTEQIHLLIDYVVPIGLHVPMLSFPFELPHEPGTCGPRRKHSRAWSGARSINAIISFSRYTRQGEAGGDSSLLHVGLEARSADLREPRLAGWEMRSFAVVTRLELSKAQLPIYSVGQVET